MQKKDLYKNTNAARNAEKQEKKKIEKKCMMLSAQNAAATPEYRLNPIRQKTYSAKTAMTQQNRLNHRKTL